MECQKSNLVKQGKAPLHNLPVITMPFEWVAVDIVGPLPLTERKNRYILTLIDMATRYPEAIPLRQVDANSVIDGLLNFFGHFGLPKELLSDRNTNFTSKLMMETCKRLSVGRILSSTYHPESNGMLERWHSTLKAMLRKSGRGRKEWDLLLPTLLFAYREAAHEAIGFSPFELVFGRAVGGPLDVVRAQWEGTETLPISVTEYLTNLYEKMDETAAIEGSQDQRVKAKYKEIYDKRSTQQSFQVGDSALVLMPEGSSKLEASYTGPFQIEEQVSPVTYRLSVRGRKKGRVVHVNLLKEWNTPTANALAVAVVPEGWHDDEGDIVTLDMGCSEMPNYGDNLTEDQVSEAKLLVRKYPELFSTTPGETDRANHAGTAKPVRLAPYRILIAYINSVREELKTMETWE